MNTGTLIQFRLLRCFYIASIILLSAVGSAYSQEINTNNWHPNTRILDEAAKYGDPVSKEAASTLARDLKRFYELLRDKKWHQTYELRAKVFREVMPENLYLAEALKYENAWGLVNYEILSQEYQNSNPATTNIDEAILICKFTELPDYAVSYSTVFWHKEDGAWKCLSAGPCKLSIFKATTQPFIDWR